jgi:hypothetical protein
VNRDGRGDAGRVRWRRGVDRVDELSGPAFDIFRSLPPIDARVAAEVRRRHAVLDPASIEKCDCRRLVEERLDVVSSQSRREGDVVVRGRVDDEDVGIEHSHPFTQPDPGIVTGCFDMEVERPGCTRCGRIRWDVDPIVIPLVPGGL